MNRIQKRFKKLFILFFSNYNKYKQKIKYKQENKIIEK